MKPTPIADIVARIIDLEHKIQDLQKELTVARLELESHKKKKIIWRKET